VIRDTTNKIAEQTQNLSIYLDTHVATILSPQMPEHITYASIATTLAINSFNACDGIPHLRSAKNMKFFARGDAV